MEKKRKLGRGLDEVADLWLSSPSIASEHQDELNGKPSKDSYNQDNKTLFPLKAISILCPESTKVKGLLTTNLALEVAKLGYGSCILDYISNGSPLRSMIGDLSQNPSVVEHQEGGSDSHQVIRLYGMPSVHLFSYTRENVSMVSKIPQYSDNLFSQIMSNNLQESIIFLYHQDTLEDIYMIENLPLNIILVSRPRKESLLISYAYIKAILAKNPQARIWVIMDEVSDRDEAIKAFNFLSQITLRRLSHTHNHMKFLGSVVHDQALGISLATHFPLVLSEEKSVAKESIARIAVNLVKLIENPD